VAEQTQERRPLKPPNNVVVLGGAGFLGSEVVRAFVAAGSSVTVVSRRLPVESRAANVAGASVIVGDATDRTLLEKVLRDADHIVDAVGSPNPSESQRAPAASLVETLPRLLVLLEALRDRTNVGMTYFSSGGTVYGNALRNPIDECTTCEPVTSYGAIKVTAEQHVAMYCRAYGLSARILRVANAYGPTQDAARGQGVVAAVLAAAMSGKSVPIYGDGRAVRDYIHAADVAQAVVRLAAVPDGPRVFNVGTSVGHSTRDVLRIVEQASGRSVPFDDQPARGFDIRRSVLDTALLASWVEWHPRTLEEGIAETWAQRNSPTAVH
jgi:UDP-glucose 4-epimerase